MTIPEETLMAYADGELDAAGRREVEAAMAADPEVARRVERHKALRRKIGAEFDPLLLETVPETLVSSVRAARPRPFQEKPAREATVTDLRRVRAARAAEAKEATAVVRRPTAAPPRTWTAFEWGAMAVSLAAGALIAYFALSSHGPELLETREGHLIAQGELDEALHNQLAGDPVDSTPIHIGVSFTAKSGDHCRTFVTTGGSAMGGLACMKDGEWRVEVLAAASSASGASGETGPAMMPAAVVTAVGQQIQGEPLDASEEAAARGRGWGR